MSGLTRELNLQRRRSDLDTVAVPQRLRPSNPARTCGTKVCDLRLVDAALGGNPAYPHAGHLDHSAVPRGFDASTGTIAAAGQHSGGDYSVEFNNQNGGSSSTWPQWAFEFAKAARLSHQCSVAEALEAVTRSGGSGGPGGDLNRVAILRAATGLSCSTGPAAVAAPDLQCTTPCSDCDIQILKAVDVSP
jgi:hypothetical protein